MINAQVNLSLVLVGSSGREIESCPTLYVFSTKLNVFETVAIDDSPNMLRIGEKLYNIRIWDTAGKDYYETLYKNTSPRPTAASSCTIPRTYNRGER